MAIGHTPGEGKERKEIHLKNDEQVNAEMWYSGKHFTAFE
jgi:hypothetical protein